MNVFFLFFFKFNIGFPILPTVIALCPAVLKIFSINLQVVDFPLVPVMDITGESLFISKKISRSVIILF